MRKIFIYSKSRGRKFFLDECLLKYILVERKCWFFNMSACRNYYLSSKID